MRIYNKQVFCQWPPFGIIIFQNETVFYPIKGVSQTNWRQLEFGDPWIASGLIQCSSVEGTLIAGPCYNAAKRSA